MSPKKLEWVRHRTIWVIVTLLAHQAEPLLAILKRSSAECILFMFNTFEPERLEAVIGSERCAFGMPFVQATLTPRAMLGDNVGGQSFVWDKKRLQLDPLSALPPDRKVPTDDRADLVRKLSERLLSFI